MPSCEPVQCDQEESTGELRFVMSYGKRRRRRAAATSSSSSQAREDLLLVQSIQITDKFGFERDGKLMDNRTKSRDTLFIESEDLIGINGLCINMAEAIIAGTVFIIAQIIIIAAWTFTWQRRKQISKHQEALSVSVSVPGMHTGIPSRADSLCKLYDAGYSRRF